MRKRRVGYHFVDIDLGDIEMIMFLMVVMMMMMMLAVVAVVVMIVKLWPWLVVALMIKPKSCCWCHFLEVLFVLCV